MKQSTTPRQQPQNARYKLGTFNDFKQVISKVDPEHAIFANGYYISSPDRYQVSKCLLNGAVVGACLEQFEPTTEFIAAELIKTRNISYIDVAVLPTWRGRGIASNMVKILPRIPNTTRLWACLKTNTASIAVAKKLGCSELVIPEEVSRRRSDSSAWLEFQDRYCWFILPN